MTTKRLKVLLGCYACDPNYGSEPGSGWNFVRTIAKHHDVHAIVEKDEFEKNLKSYALEHPDEVKHITFHFIRRKHHNTLRKFWPPSYYWFYRLWQKKAYKYAIELHKKEKFDLVHQVSLIGYREPGYLWKLGIPFIWGPLGGLNQTAWCLLKGMGIHAKIYFGMRNIINAYQKRFSRVVRQAAANADTIFVSDPQGIDDVKKLWHKVPSIMREVGTSSSKPIHLPSEHRPGTPLKICWIGELIPLKALDILLDALPLCTNPMQVEVLGKGPQLKKWKTKCKTLGICDRVTFHGFIPHHAVKTVMENCHILCVTSIKEGGTSTVVLEALQCGLPIIALNHCGHASVINDTCGIKIDIKSRQQVVLDLAYNLDNLANDEAHRKSMSEAAIKHSLNFTWEATEIQLSEVYREAVKRHAIREKPCVSPKLQ